VAPIATPGRSSAHRALAPLAGGLIVSCQARPDNPLHGPTFMAAMARAAADGGAVGLRVNGPDDIRAARAATSLPIIGLFKRQYDDSPVVITPTFAEAEAVARAGATIIGGMLFGLSRRAATEFSFFLAVPTLIAAGAYDFYRNRGLFDAGDLGVFTVGFIVSFVSAFLCVRWLLRYIASHDFSVFAWYRIAFGAIVLATGYAGLVDWSPA